jgi:hypothetical protein
MVVKVSTKSFKESDIINLSLTGGLFLADFIIDNFTLFIEGLVKVLRPTECRKSGKMANEKFDLALF